MLGASRPTLSRIPHLRLSRAFPLAMVEREGSRGKHRPSLEPATWDGELPFCCFVPWLRSTERRIKVTLHLKPFRQGTPTQPRVVAN